MMVAFGSHFGRQRYLGGYRQRDYLYTIFGVANIGIFGWPVRNANTPPNLLNLDWISPQKSRPVEVFLGHGGD